MRRIALLCAVLAAGCGGGDGLTREEFVAELGRICADFNETEDALPEPQTLDELVEQGTTVRREFGAAIERIRDLGEPPEEIEADVDRFLELADATHALVGDVVEAAEAGEAERIQELAQEGAELTEESDGIANELGAENCDQG